MISNDNETLASAAPSTSSPQRKAAIALAILTVTNLLNYYDRTLIVVVSQPLRDEFNLTDTQYGLLAGPAFVLVYALSSLVFGWLADRHNRRTIICSALAAWSIMTALVGLAQSFALLALARAGVGVGEGGANPAGMSLLSDHYPPVRRTFALAIYTAGGMFGLFLSFVLGSWIAVQYGWRAVFIVAAIPGLILALCGLLLLSEPPRGRFETTPPQLFSYREGLQRLRANRAFVWGCSAAAMGTFGSLGMVIWLPQFFIRTHGLTVQQIGLYFGPTAALGLFAGVIAGGMIGSRMARTSLAEPLILCVVANFTLIPLYLLALWSPNLPLALVLTFAAMAISTSYSPAFLAAVQNICEPSTRGTASAVCNVVIAIIGQGLLPLSIGVVSDALAPVAGAASLRWALTISTGFMLISGLLFITTLRLSVRHYAAANPLASAIQE
ncbi:spinster family MFS transporter [Massilia cavernae]|nr:MFS transporter [Massilia cavernae]